MIICCCFAGAALPSALPTGASAVNGGTAEQEQAGSKVALEDLFKDVWMAEEEEEEPEDESASSINHVPDTEVTLCPGAPCCIHVYKC